MEVLNCIESDLLEIKRLCRRGCSVRKGLDRILLMTMIDGVEVAFAHNHKFVFIWFVF